MATLVCEVSVFRQEQPAAPEGGLTVVAFRLDVAVGADLFVVDFFVLFAGDATVFLGAGDVGVDPGLFGVQIAVFAAGQLAIVAALLDALAEDVAVGVDSVFAAGEGGTGGQYEAGGGNEHGLGEHGADNGGGHGASGPWIVADLVSTGCLAVGSVLMI